MSEDCEECIALRQRIADYEDSHRATMAEVCHDSDVGPEKHCTCVPYLREEIRQLRDDSNWRAKLT